jgi:hypothetical protein
MDFLSDCSSFFNFLILERSTRVNNIDIYTGHSTLMTMGKWYSIPMALKFTLGLIPEGLVALGIIFTEAQVERSVESGRSASLYTNIFLHCSLLLHFLLLSSRSITGISVVFVNIKS